MNTSITLDEIYMAKHGINQYLEKYQHAISGIELTPHIELFDKETQGHIASYCSNHNLDVNYHAPDFISPYFDIGNYTTDKIRTTDEYTNFIDNICRIQGITNKIGTIAIHGGSINNDRNRAFNSTLKFFDWILNYLSRSNININLSIELLANRHDNIGCSRDETKSIVNEFNTSNLGICFDITHDYYNNGFKYLPMDDGILQLINYVHIHGIKNTIPIADHIDLRDSDLIFNDYILGLKSASYNGFINLELLSKTCADYDTALHNSLIDLNRLIATD